MLEAVKHNPSMALIAWYVAGVGLFLVAIAGFLRYSGKRKQKHSPTERYRNNGKR